jgi:hypothetical protein
MAVGVRVTLDGRKLTLAQRWNGSQWKIEPTPNPSPTLPLHELNAISCSSAPSCVAVGDFGQERFNPYYAATINGLIERWSGHRWSVQPVTYAQPETTYQLESVSCPRASACLIVGEACGRRLNTDPPAPTEK